MKSSIPGVQEDFTAQLIEILSTESNVDEIILYGSRAKGNYKKGSDIDLTVKGEGLTLDWQLAAETKLDDLLLPYKIDLSIYNHIDNNDLINHIERIGKVIYKR